jgi:hypothetical protein
MAVCRQKQRAIMNEYFYDADSLRSQVGAHENGSAGRVLVFCFARATSIFLSRLLEVNTLKNGANSNDLRNIYIISIPWPDDIGRAGGDDELISYRRGKFGEYPENLPLMIADQYNNYNEYNRNILNMEKHKIVFKRYAGIIVPVASN